MADGRVEPVRYIGIDTPELDLGDEEDSPVVRAYLANRKLVAGKWVRMERNVTNRDRSNRLLRYVYVGKVFVNAEFVRLGHARPMTIAPNVRHRALFARLRREARKPCDEFVGLMVKDLRRRSRKAGKKSTPMAEKLVKLVGRALTKDAAPAECAAMVKKGLPDYRTPPEALEGVFDQFLTD